MRIDRPAHGRAYARRALGCLAAIVAPLALSLPLGCSVETAPSERVGEADQALTVGDWSLFPDGHQCVVGVQIFYAAKFGAKVPATGGPGWNGVCAPLGACHLWLDTIPNPAVWDRIPNDGSQEPTLYDMIVYPPKAGNSYGHVASVDHVTNGAIYVMDDNYCANNCEKKAAEPHTVSSVAYGWYHLKALAAVCVPSPEVCNGKDDNCNGQVDEGLVQACGSDVGECVSGLSTCENGAPGACVGAKGPTDEVCNGKDDDCDGVADNHDVCERDEADEAALFDEGASSDVDGDGRADACALGPEGITCVLAGEHGFGAAWPPVALPGLDPLPRSVFTTLRLGDVDGDGRADACLRLPDGVSCWLSNGHGFDRRIVGPPLSDESGWNGPDAASIRLADVNGDGRADLCARGSSGLVCFLATGHAFVPGPTLPALSDAAGFGDVNRAATLRMGDLDGDGRADVCARDANGMLCWRAGDHGFTERILGPRWSDAAGFGAWSRWSTIRIADVDGDGRVDLCALEEGGFRCALFDGKAFGTKVLGPALLDAQPEAARRERAGTIRLADVDGDGRADLCARVAEGPDGEPGLRCWLWSGHAFDRVIVGPALADEDGWARPDRYRTLRLADVNGDGKADLCGRGEQGLTCWLAGAFGFPARVAGPSWSDAAGWAEPARFGSIRLAGGGAPASSGLLFNDAASPGGKASCSVVTPAPSTDATALVTSALAGLLLGARRRRRLAPHGTKGS